ncbi:MAG: hypothetical protein WA269_07790, partial [Candidatus Udaeobacter sp.]
ISPKFPPLNQAVGSAQVERVVLNALAKTCGFAARYLRLRRINTHRLEDKPIHLRSRKDR